VNSLNIERLKFIGGAIIVAAAALIMFPEIIKVAFGLGRIFMVLLVAGGACLFLATTSHRIKKLKDAQHQVPPITVTRSPEAVAQENDSSGIHPQ
jgi:hypothetical protein